MPKAVLYGFDPSVWATASAIAVAALGYTDADIELKQINLAEGENFKPGFLKINRNGTLPTLVEPNGYIVHGRTKSVVRYLIKHAPKPELAGKSSGSDLIEKLHSDAVDPNFAMIGFRNDEELAEKAKGSVGAYIAQRQAALQKYADTSPPEFEEFYESKIVHNGLMYTHLFGISAKAKQALFNKTTRLWDSIKEFITEALPGYLPEPESEGKFIGGAAPGEDDFHLVAWLGRIALVNGGAADASGVDAISKVLEGAAVPAKVKAYWVNWASTEAFKKAYADGLH